jgi:isopentenyldiphosphate isomerase
MGAAFEGVLDSSPSGFVINQRSDYSQGRRHASIDSYNSRGICGIPLCKHGYFGDFLSTHRLQTLLTDLNEVAQQKPAPDSVPLVIDETVCGYVSAVAVKALLPSWPNHLVAGRFVLTANAQLSEQLKQMAIVLLNSGCISRWRDELLDVWCGNNAVAAIERGAVRSLGLLTRAVHLNAWSRTGNLWVARRALDKATDPGMWDTLVGGLVGHGEPDELALERESAEEAGLSALQITAREPIRVIYRMQRRVPEGFQWEEVLTSECVLADDVIPQNQDGEVMEIVCLPVQEIEEMLLEGQFTVEASIVIAQSLLIRQKS